MTRRTLGRAVAGFAVGGALGRALAPTPALAGGKSAAVCLDGDNRSSAGPADGIAQTFTPTLSGKVSRVDVTVSHTPTTTAGYLVRILKTDAGGTPILSPVLAEKVFPISAVPGGGFVSLKFRFKKRKAAKVVKDTKYAILVTRDDPAVDIVALVRTSNPCTGGNFFFLSSNSFLAEANDDLVFETFVGY